METETLLVPARIQSFHLQQLHVLALMSRCFSLTVCVLLRGGGVCLKNHCTVCPGSQLHINIHRNNTCYSKKHRTCSSSHIHSVRTYFFSQLFLAGYSACLSFHILGLPGMYLMQEKASEASR